MDQCKHCISRGDIKKCMHTTCCQHESWIATIRMKRIEKLEALLQAMISAQHAGLITDEMFTAWNNAEIYLTGSK